MALGDSAVPFLTSNDSFEENTCSVVTDRGGPDGCTSVAASVRCREPRAPVPPASLHPEAGRSKLVCENVCKNSEMPYSLCTKEKTSNTKKHVAGGGRGGNVPYIYINIYIIYIFC